jgi:hypothetical protein
MSSSRDPIGQRRAVDELHDEAHGPVAARDAIDMRDVRVVECGQRLGFLLEARDAVGIVGERGGKHLDRDVALELGIARAIDLARAAGADRFDNFLLAEVHARTDAQRACAPTGLPVPLLSGQCTRSTGISAYAPPCKFGPEPPYGLVTR